MDFHWNASDPWTIVSVSDDCESTGGGGTLQVINRMCFFFFFFFSFSSLIVKNIRGMVFCLNNNQLACKNKMYFKI